MNANHIKFELVDNPDLEKRYVSIERGESFSIDNKTFFGPKVIIIRENKKEGFCKLETYPLNESKWLDLLHCDMKNKNWRLINEHD